MKALSVTIPRDRLPEQMVSHWHLVDTIISRHVVTAVEHNYQGCEIVEYEWQLTEAAPTCHGCGEQIGARYG